MSSGGTTRNASMLVAASIGTVEALKDQAGLCRWNYAMRSLCRHTSNGAGSLSVKDHVMATVVSPNSALDRESKDGGANGGGKARGRRSEEKLEKAYHLICWGPN